MKKALLALIVIVLTTTAATGQQPWAEKMFTDGKLTHDFGTVPHGAQLAHTFTITNIYAVPMQITQITPSCGCVTAEAVKRVLNPRESTTIEVKMDGRNFTGPKKVDIRVTVGPDFMSTATLTVKANSRTDVVFNPGAAAFGIVPLGQTPSLTIDVEYAGTLAWQVSEAAAPKEAPFEATYKELYRRPGQVGYQVKVTLKAGAAPGPFRDYVYLKTDDPNSPSVPVLVEGTVQSALKVSPPALSLGTVKAGESLTRRVLVNGNKPFRVLSIDAPAGVTLGAELSSTPDAVQKVTFKCVPANAGPFKYEVKIKTDLQEPPVTVVIDGAAEQ